MSFGKVLLAVTATVVVAYLVKHPDANVPHGGSENLTGSSCYIDVAGNPVSLQSHQVARAVGAGYRKCS